MRGLIIPQKTRLSMNISSVWTKRITLEDKTQRIHSANGSAFNTDIYSVSAENIINDGFSGDRSVVRRSITPKVH
jgi:hypothetical protein